MKKIVRLTEKDLSRIVRRVIKEENDDDTEDFINPIRNNRDQLDVIKSDLKDKTALRIEGADTITATRLLKNYIKFSKDNVKYIAILRSEGVDLSDIDFCECYNLKLINLKGTPNNFEETQNDDCYTKIGEGMYDFINT